MAGFANDGKLGVDLGSGKGVDASATFALGTTARVSARRTAIYVFAGEAIASAGAAAISTAFTASASAGGFSAPYALASGEFGWVVGDQEAL